MKKVIRAIISLATDHMSLCWYDAPPLTQQERRCYYCCIHWTWAWRHPATLIETQASYTGCQRRENKMKKKDSDGGCLSSCLLDSRLVIRLLREATCAHESRDDITWFYHWCSWRSRVSHRDSYDSGVLYPMKLAWTCLLRKSNHSNPVVSVNIAILCTCVSIFLTIRNV